MPGRNWKFRLEDILEAVEAILDNLKGMTFEEFCQDKTKVKATLYNFAVIGEASRHVPEQIKRRTRNSPGGR